MRNRLPNSTSALFRSMGGLRRPPPAAPKMVPPKPFYQESAKKQMSGYLQVAGGKSYLKSSFEKGLKEERRAFEHGQREGLTKEELYALSKMSRGGPITKEKAKVVAGAALEIAREHEREAGGLAPGLRGGTLKEGAKRLMRMEKESEPKPEPPKPMRQDEPGTRISALQDRLRIQHGPMNRSAIAPNVAEPTRLPDTPAGWSTPVKPSAETPPADQTPNTPAPAAPRLSQFSEGFTGGGPMETHRDADQPAPGIPVPTLRHHEPDQSEPAATAPDQDPASQLPDTSHVDEGLPF